MEEKTEIGIRSERIAPDEYIDFLKRTDLGSQYPRERFEERIERLLKNASVSLTARDGENRLRGVRWFRSALLTRWAYLRRGIGTRLMKEALALAGGDRDIAVYLIANDDAVPFYEKLGMRKAEDVMQYNHVDWTAFRVE